ncbi:phage minor head protein [soil metagenome]
MIERKRTPNPLIPGSPRERTGTAGILRRAVGEINQRFAGLKRDVLAAFARIPVYAINEDDRPPATPPPVRYGVTAQVLDQTILDLQAALERWILTGKEAGHIAWWDVYNQEAQQLGAAQTAANLTNLSPVYAAARSLETVVFSEPYRTRAAIARTRNTEYWTGLSSQARSDLAGVIGRAVVDGKNPKAAVTEIAERLDVSRSRARLYAQTDVTGTLREARWAEGEDAEEELGVRTALLWTSAFLPTTRTWHASRSGQTYSREEVKSFYAKGGERFRCHCAQTEALLDADGKPILTKYLQSAMANERKAWQKRALG